MKCLIVLATVVLVAGCTSTREIATGTPKRALACSLTVGKEEYKAGETATFTVSLTNTGQLPLRVVKAGGAGSCLSHINWQSDDPRKVSPLTCECDPMPFTGKLAETVLLKPGEIHQFAMNYTLSKLHRQFRHAFVTYAVPSYEGWPVDLVKLPKWVEEVEDTSPLWTGVTSSPRITLAIIE